MWYQTQNKEWLVWCPIVAFYDRYHLTEAYFRDKVSEFQHKYVYL